MYKLLVRLFIKNKDDVKNEKVRSSYGVLASAFGIFSNMLASALKIVVGFLSSTISILADGINNLADMLSSVVALIGFKLSRKKPDKEHPYGHERIEYIAGFIISAVIVILGVQLIIDSVKEIGVDKAPSDKFWLNVGVLVAAILIKLYQAIFNFKVGKTINSTTIKATAIDSRNDIIATSIVLVGYIISYFTKVNLDSYLGTLVGLFITYSGFKLILESSSTLLGEAPDKDLVQRFKDILESNNIVLGIHDLEIHSYGPSKVYASCHVEVDSRGDILTLHDEIDRLENRCKTELGVQTTLHLDPLLVDDPLTNELKEFVLETLKELPFKWNIHDFRIVTGPTHTNTIFDIVIPFDVEETEEEIKVLVNDLINTRRSDVFAVVDIDYDHNDTL